MVIYVIENKINGKKYVGQTRDIRGRMAKHRMSANNPKDSCYNYMLYKDIRKYGKDNFKYEIIDKANSQGELDEKESFWIKKFGSDIDTGHGYNGFLGGIHGKATRATNLVRAVKVKNITDNIVYESMTDCALIEYKDINAKKGIHKCCSPHINRFTYKGKEYRYVDEGGNIIQKDVVPTKISNKKIKVIDLKTGVIFKSIKECSEKLKISKTMIRDRLYKRVKNDKYINHFDLQIYNK